MDRKNWYKKLLLILELIILFIGIPVLIYFYMHKSDDFLNIKSFLVPLFLSIVAISITVFLWIDKSFIFRRLKKLSHFKYYIKEIFHFFIPIVIISIVLTYFLFPKDLFILPRKEFFLWCLIMVFYPIFSVLPQGILFRVFFFSPIPKTI